MRVKPKHRVRRRGRSSRSSISLRPGSWPEARPRSRSPVLSATRDFIAHYSESDQKLLAYDPGQLEPLLRKTQVLNVPAVNPLRDTLIVGVGVTDEIVDRLRD
jgi:hypothetical protein